MDPRILAALGLPADASEEVVLKRLSELTPKAPVAPSIETAAFDAIAREAHHEVRLQTEIATLKEKDRVSSVREILRATDRYTSPAFESYALTKTPDEVRGMLLNMPSKPSALYAPSKESRTELTAADRKLCALLGTDERAVLAHKAELMERDRNRQHRGIRTGEDF